MRRLLCILAFLCFGTSIRALSPGDIAFVEYNANPDRFEFVAMVDIPAGTIIWFTDNGWLAVSGFRMNEGWLKWTAPAGGVACGTIVDIYNSSGWGTSSGTITTATPTGCTAGSGFDLSTSGDQIVAFQGDCSLGITNIAAINNEGAGVWQADATSSNTSALPSGLTNGTNAFARNETDFTYYNVASINDTRANILASINNNTNWTSSGSTVDYTGTITNTSCASCTTPTTQASGLSFSSIQTNQMTVSWSGNGNGDGVIVVAEAGAAVDNPVNGTDYIANAAFGSGGSPGAGSYVVYEGTGSSVTVTNLSACTQYAFKVFAFDCSGASILYQTANGTNNPLTQYTINRPNQAQNIVFQNVTGTTMDIKWSAPVGGCDGYIVKYGTNNTFTDISDAASLPSGGTAPWTDEEVIFTNSNHTGVTISGLSASATHYFKVYSYRLCNGTYYFNNTEASSNMSSKATLANPADPAAVCSGSSLAVSINIGDISNATYQWKVYNSGTGNWDNLVNGAPYSGVNTSSLIINPATSSMDGNQYLCQVGNSLHICLITTPSQTINIYGLPETPAIIDVTNNCDNTVLTHGAPPGGVTWYWQGTNANGTSTLNSAASTTVTSDGTYYLRAQSSDGCWSASSASEAVTIKVTPSATVTATAGCGQGTVRVSSSLIGEQTFDLRDNSGNSLVPERTYTGNTGFYDFSGLPDGTYRAYITKEGCTSALSGSTVLTNNAIPGGAAMADNYRCGNGNVLMTATIGAGGTAVEFSTDGSTVAATDNSAPYEYNVIGVVVGTPQILYARTTNGICQSEWISAMATAIGAAGVPTPITGVLTPRCAQDLTETYTTSAVNATTFTWEILNAVEGTDFNFLGTKSTVSEEVEWFSGYSGTATIRVKANNVCGSSAWTTQDVVISKPTISSSAITHVSCFGGYGSIQLSVTGGITNYNYSWTGGGTANPQTKAAGAYSITVTDAIGCTTTGGAYTITQPATVTASIIGTTHITCNGFNNGIATVVGSGGTTTYSYLWSNGGTLTTTSGLGLGANTVTITDSKGCYATGSVNITQPAVLTLTGTVTHVLIAGNSTGAIDVSVTGGTTTYNFAWNTGASLEDISSLTAGAFSITVTDSKGCTISASYLITQPSGLSVTAALTHVICNGESTGNIILTVQGGVTPYTYLWSNASTTKDLINIAAANYFVTITDNAGGNITGNYHITEPAPAPVGVPVFVAGVTSIRCINTSAVTYTANAVNSTGITYAIQSISGTGTNPVINASTGEVTYAADFYGTITIRATATGCNGPSTADHNAITAHPDPSITDN